MNYSLLLISSFFVAIVYAIESPEFKVIFSESDFEIRLYADSAWMSAQSDQISFEQATKFGFHRLFQYIQGANLNWSRIPMTTPVLTSIDPDAGPLHSSAYVIRLYLPVKYQSNPPLPLPELNLKPSKFPSHCIAVRKFSGFARDGNIIKEAEKLSRSLSQSSLFNSSDFLKKSGYSIAQYSSPFRVIGRVNEVLADVDGSLVPGCEIDGERAVY